jgi:catechol 2,3-dioxygenase-like lactoylglutathione lyase family enzyme
MQVAFWEGDQMVFLNTPGSEDLITLYQAPEPEPVAGGGVSHFGFRMEKPADHDLAIKEVERAGGKMLKRGEHSPGHPFLYVADPDGYVIEL